MSDAPHIIHTERADTMAETELNVLATVYRFILDCYAKKKAAEPTPEPDGHDEAKE
jgi:hypothetical protein